MTDTRTREVETMLSRRSKRAMRSMVLACWFGLALSGCANPRGPWEPIAGRPDPAAAAASTAAPISLAGGPAPVAPASAGATPAATPGADLIEGQLALARLCERRGEVDQAEEYYNGLLKKTPQDARPHHRLAILAVQKGDFARAEEHYRVALAAAPNDVELLSDVGYTLYLQRRLPEAEACLRRALTLEPTHASATNNLALVVGTEGRFDEALMLFKRANPEAEAYANLAYVMAQNGQTARAQDTYLKALTLDQNLRVAAQAMLQVADRGQAQAQARLAVANRPAPPAGSVANVAPAGAAMAATPMNNAGPGLPTPQPEAVRVSYESQIPAGSSASPYPSSYPGRIESRP